jgi:hypothetical protein
MVFYTVSYRFRWNQARYELSVNFRLCFEKSFLGPQDVILSQIQCWFHAVLHEWEEKIIKG